MALFNNVSVWWHVAGVVIILGMCIAFAPDVHNTLSTIFSFSSRRRARRSPASSTARGSTTSPIPFIGITAYVFLIGMLLAQYTLTGYDASAHMTEETHQADVSGPNGIWKSIVISVFFGYILLVGVWYVMQGQAGYDAARVVPARRPAISRRQRRSSSTRSAKVRAIFALIIVMGAQFFCGMASVTTNSRMIYAFSRDGAVPGHKAWHTINKRTRTPTNAIWLAVVLAWLLVAPAYWYGSIVAYFAVTAIGVIGLYIAYIIPIFLRRTAGADFKAGPWQLGKWSALIGWVAIIWVLFICIVLMLPQFNWGPGGGDLKFIDVFNYAPVVVGLVVLVTGLWWIISAHKWFTGPKVQGTPEELAAIERELGEVG